MQFSNVMAVLQVALLVAIIIGLRKLRIHMATSNAELSAKLTAIGDQLEKAKNEIVAEVQTLKDALANTTITPEADASLTRLQGLAQGLDDLNPDATPTPPPVP